MLKKNRQRRSRHFAVLTYSVHAPRVKQWLPPAGCSKQFVALLDDFFEHSRWLLISALLWTFLSYLNEISNRPIISRESDEPSVIRP